MFATPPVLIPVALNPRSRIANPPNRKPKIENRKSLLILLLSLLALPAMAQDRRGEPGLGEFYTYGDNYYLEVTTYPGTTPAKGRGVVTFRLTYDLLTFRKVSQAHRREGIYIATPSLYMEAIGVDGVIVDRRTWRDTARALDYPATNSKQDFLSGAVEMALRPGVYTIKYTFDDGIPGSGFTQSTPPFKMDDFHSPSPAIGLPLFLRDVMGDTLVTASVDGAAMFGRPLRAYIPLSSTSEPKSLHYELQTVVPKGKSGNPSSLRSGFATLLGRATVSEAISSGNDIFFLVRRGAGDTAVPGPSCGALIETGTDDLAVGEYMLLLTYESGGNSVTDSIRFRLRWVDMPISLARSEYAIKALYPVATDEVIDLMLGESKEQQRIAIDQFWKQRDPTPGTMFNEAMHEYYKRVDYSFFNFKSIGQSDGTFTDRGKIYILYGPPTEVNRELQPEGAPREIWVYRNRVGRRFIFTDESRTGYYRLVEYNDL